MPAILTADLVLVLLNKFVVPELARWIQSRRDAGQPITEADLRAKLAADANDVIVPGLAFLAEHPEPEAPLGVALDGGAPDAGDAGGPV